MTEPRRVRVKLDRKEQKDCVVTLTVRFDPELLGATRSGLLFAGVAQAVGAVLSREDQAEMLRQLEAERVRLGLSRTGAPKKKARR